MIAAAGPRLADAVAGVRDEIARAARRAGRDPAAVTLVAVSKTKPLEALLEAYAAGIRHFGENRVQEAEAKFPHLPAGCVRHLIGPLQTNKVKKAARVADVVETIDRPEVAERLARAAVELGRRLEVLIEVRLGGEETKSGIVPEALGELVGLVRVLSPLVLRGLMTVPPPGEGRTHFRRLRELAENHGLPDLSMGMSGDFCEAVEEGATIVRVGTRIFGER